MSRGIGGSRCLRVGIRKEVTGMMLADVFEPFVKVRPIAVMARGVLERLLDTERVDDLFECTARNLNLILKTVRLCVVATPAAVFAFVDRPSLN